MSPTKAEKELATKVNEQEEQLSRYKKRLQDVVVAHKKLISEKERLEESLKTITSSIVTSDPYENADDSDKEKNELNAKVTKLAQSLSSLAEEKRRLEAEFQIERKQLVQQNSQLEEELKNLSSSVTNVKKVQETVGKTATRGCNPKELDSASNVRELQKIISEERRKREEKETVLEKLEEELGNVTDKLNESKENEQQLQMQVNDVKKQLENETAPQFVMDKLKRELQIMREQHNYAIQQAQTRALKAEERSRKLAIEHENRVLKLEQKLVQFSDLASNYDRHRQEDQQTITKLKNRLMQLELENSNIKCEDDRTTSNEETLVQQLQHIKHQLLLGCRNANQLNNLRKLLLEGLKNPIKDEDLEYKQQYLQLKKQFDDYIQKHPENENNESRATNKQKIHAHKVKLLEAEGTIATLKQEIEMQREHTDELLERERRLWKTKIVSLESEYRNKAIVLERELQKQRERVTAIIEEKEKQMLDMQHCYTPVYHFSEDPSSTDTKTSGRQRSYVIHYDEEAARKEVDVNRLRKENNELQMKIHDVEKELFQQIQLYSQLQQEIERFRKQQDDPEELNNTYLRNVLSNYFLTTDSKMRTHMLNAIFAILKFSDWEINLITKAKVRHKN